MDFETNVFKIACQRYTFNIFNINLSQLSQLSLIQVLVKSVE